MNINESMVISASPEAVWSIGGDPGTVADWLPAIEKSHLDGDIRHATLPGVAARPPNGSWNTTTPESTTSTSI
jgi:hypothetical protein